MRDRPLAGRAGAQARAAIRAAMGARPGRGGWMRPAMTAACMGVPLGTGVAVGHASWGMVASLGAFTGFYGHSEPYRHRARLLAGLALALAATIVVGSLAHGSVVAAVAVTGVVTAVATLLCIAVQTGPPREHFLVLACLMTSTLPVAPESALARGGLALAGGAVAWLVVMSGWLRDRSAPERTAVASAFARIADLLDASAADAGPNGPARPGTATRATRHQATLAARTAAHAVAHAGGPAAGRLRAVRAELDELLDAALALGLIGERPDPAWSPHIRALAATIAARPPAPAPGACGGSRTTTVLDPPRAFAGGGLAPPSVRIPRALEAVGAALRGETEVPAPAPRRPLRAALGAHSLAVPTALRGGLALAAAVALGHALHVGQSYWIALTVSAILQGATLVTSLRRAIERALGTLVGILIAAGIVALDPRAAILVAVIVVLQLLIESVIQTSYAVAVAFITPLTMLLSELAAPGTVSDAVLGGRVVDTALGCLLGVAAGRLLWPRAARTQLDASMQRSLRATSELLATALRPDADPGHLRRARSALQVELLNLRAVEEAALGDRLTDAPDADARWPVVASVERLGTLVSSAPITPGAIPRMPRTQAELEHLHGLLAAEPRVRV